MLDNEIHDVRKILQEQVAKLAVLERDYQRVLNDVQDKSAQVKMLEASLNAHYRRGLFEGLAIAEFTAALNSDAEGSIQNITDALREGDVTINDVVLVLRDLAAQVAERNSIEAKPKNAAEATDEDGEDYESFKERTDPRVEAVHYSITGKPLASETNEAPNVTPIAGAN